MKSKISPITENKSIDKKIEFSRKIRDVILNENSITNKISKDIPKEKKFSIKSNNLLLSSNFNKNRLYKSGNYSKMSFPLIKEKTSKDFNSMKYKNFFSEGNDNNSEINNINDNNIENYINKPNLHIKTNKKFFVKVNRIVNSLINSPKKNLSDYLNPQIIGKKDKTRFPFEKLINPLYYIKYNVNANPINRSTSKGFKQYVQELENGVESRKNNNELLLNSYKDINYGNIQIENPYLSNIELNYKNIFEQTKQPKNFVFNKKDIYGYKKLAIHDNNYIKKLEMKNRKNLREKYKKFFIDGNRNKNKKFVDSFLDNNIKKYQSFDERMEMIVNNTRITENIIKQKSQYHEKLINKINHIYKMY